MPCGRTRWPSEVYRRLEPFIRRKLERRVRDLCRDTSLEGLIGSFVLDVLMKALPEGALRSGQREANARNGGGDPMRAAMLWRSRIEKAVVEVSQHITVLATGPIDRDERTSQPAEVPERIGKDANAQLIANLYTMVPEFLAQASKCLEVSVGSEEAHDVVHEVFLELIANPALLNGKGNALYYIKGAIKFRCVNRLRRPHAYIASHENLDPLNFDLLSGESFPDCSAAFRSRDLLIRLGDVLDSEEMLIGLLRFYGNHSYLEVKEALEEYGLVRSTKYIRAKTQSIAAIARKLAS